VCAMPPAIQRRITVSALAFIVGAAQELNRVVGIPDAIAANVAALVFCKNSLRFQFLFMIQSFHFITSTFNKSIETPEVIEWPTVDPEYFPLEVMNLIYQSLLSFLIFLDYGSKTFCIVH